MNLTPYTSHKSHMCQAYNTFVGYNDSPPGGSEKLAILQEAWAGCQGEWKRSDLFLKLTSRKSHTSFGARVWMTKSQLTNKYGNAAIADTIIQAKLDDPKLCESCVKWHPDAPGNQAMCCWV